MKYRDMIPIAGGKRFVVSVAIMGNDEALPSIFYSYRSAEIGLSREARSAG